VALGDGELREAEDFVSHWDYATPLRLVRRLKVRPDIAAADLGIGADSLDLALSLRLGTGQGRMARSIIRRDWHSLDGERPELELDFNIEGCLLSNVLDLQTQIVLGADLISAGELSPRHQGARLWQDVKRIRLEGEEPRFPMEVADLRSLLGDSAAADSPWYLHWSPLDWTCDFHGSIRLYLNSRDRDMIARVENGDPETLRALMADVMGQVCECLVREDDPQAILDACDAGSLGSQASFWLELAFPGLGVDHARSLLENRPGVFRASFQAIAVQQGEFAE
tara:strand:- start:155 stop:1000 length:846 start_codon:yes stop_codon:yes gene_type:complete